MTTGLGNTHRTRTRTQTAAAAVGAVVVLVGVLGLVPGIVTHHDDHEFAGQESEGQESGAWRGDVDAGT